MNNDIQDYDAFINFSRNIHLISWSQAGSRSVAGSNMFESIKHSVAIGGIAGKKNITMIGESCNFIPASSLGGAMLTLG